VGKVDAGVKDTQRVSAEQSTYVMGAETGGDQLASADDAPGRSAAVAGSSAHDAGDQRGLSLVGVGVWIAGELDASSWLSGVIR